MARRRNSTRRTASVRAASRRTQQRRVKPKNAIDVICSDCHEEFLYNPESEGEEMLCPVCEHACDRPDDAQVHRVADLRGKEKRGLVINMVLMFVFLGSAAAWFGLTQNPTVHPDGDAALFWGPFAVGILSLIGMLVMSIKYESSRWETYF